MKKISKPFQIKSLDESGGFEGYGSVFHVQDYQNDVVMPGAFSKSLQKHESAGTVPAMLLFHDHARPCGIFEKIAEDARGLYVQGRLLLGSTDGKDAYELVRAKALNGLSIGYRPLVEEYDRDQNVNLLKEVDLWEISLVTFPANDAARVTSVKTARDFEGFLRNAGFSSNLAKEIAVRGWRYAHDITNDREIIEAIQKNIHLLRY